MSKQFKIGDTVKCVDNGNYRYLTLNQVYKIVNTRIFMEESFITVSNDNNEEVEYYSRRFKKVEQKMLPKIVYIDTVNSELNKVVVDYLEKLGMNVNQYLKTEFFRYIYIYSDEFSVEGCKTTTNTINCISINQLYEMKFNKPITVNGHKVVKLENGLQIGCTTISMEQIEELYKLAKS